MNREAEALEMLINRGRTEFESAQRRLDTLRRTCQHKWSKPEYKPIIREGYQDPGDAPGTMGVDWRGPTWIPAKETPKWERHCTECGLIEETFKTEDHVTKTPVFGRGW